MHYASPHIVCSEVPTELICAPLACVRPLPAVVAGPPSGAPVLAPGDGGRDDRVVGRGVLHAVVLSASRDGTIPSATAGSSAGYRGKSADCSLVKREPVELGLKLAEPGRPRMRTVTGRVSCRPLPTAGAAPTDPSSADGADAMNPASAADRRWSVDSDRPAPRRRPRCGVMLAARIGASNRAPCAALQPQTTRAGRHESVPRTAANRSRGRRQIGPTDGVNRSRGRRQIGPVYVGNLHRGWRVEARSVLGNLAPSMPDLRSDTFARAGRLPSRTLASQEQWPARRKWSRRATGLERRCGWRVNPMKL